LGFAACALKTVEIYLEFGAWDLENFSLLNDVCFDFCKLFLGQDTS
jgi:hypothetical protein